MIPHTFLLLFRVKIVRSPNDLFKKKTQRYRECRV